MLDWIIMFILIFVGGILFYKPELSQIPTIRVLGATLIVIGGLACLVKLQTTQTSQKIKTGKWGRQKIIQWLLIIGTSSFLLGFGLFVFFEWSASGYVISRIGMILFATGMFIYIFRPKE
jgi:hypothetical protein